jgi:hypothetical protein
VIIDEIHHKCGDGSCELSGRVRAETWNKEELTLWYRFPSDLAGEHESASPDASAFLAGMLLWCLFRDEPLRIEGTVSPRLHDAVPLITDVVRSFWPGQMTPVKLIADTREPGPGNPAVGSFFTRGVDSWYTALTHGDRAYDGPPLTHLVYVPSVDFMFDEEHLARSIVATSAAATEAGKTPVVVESNLRRHTEHFLHWGIYGGAGLASMALALGSSRMHLPASRSFAGQVPHCTHLFLDPLWSTGRTEIIHHGAEADRWQKLQYLADKPSVLSTLKLCFNENTDGNCGRCPKCLVTMVMLDAIGVLDQCPFDVPLDPARVARMELDWFVAELMRSSVLPEISDPRLASAVHRATLRATTRDVVTQGRDALRAFGAAIAQDPQGFTTLFRRPQE